MSVTQLDPSTSNGEDATPGVVSADAQPWISYSEPRTAKAEPTPKATPRTSVLAYYAVGGALGVAALAAGVLLVARRRAQRMSFGQRVARALASPLVRTLATSLGGAALAGGTALLEDSLARYVSSRAALASSTD